MAAAAAMGLSCGSEAGTSLDPCGVGEIEHGNTTSAAVPLLRERDIITEVDGSPVTTAAEAASRLNKERAGGHLVRVRRGEGALFAVIPPSKSEG